MLTLAISNLSVGYGPRLIVENLSATFPAGQVVCIQAPTGRGKTTLLAALGGLLIPAAGEVSFDDRPAAPDLLRASATWVLQSQNVLPFRSAADNVALGGALHLDNWEQAAAGSRALLKHFGLESRQDAPAARLSGGERQRVCVARALMANVPVILADEPTASLDRIATTTVIDALRLAAKQDRIVVVASHDPEVGSGSDTVLRL